ncbi:MAG: 50S ribosomal subunit protein L31 [Candidatus Westeberhardia cardiocondylae]|nr:50S ribosomal subunit protein L31 [Candidatus Westeberhardia cardiocondylae]
MKKNIHPKYNNICARCSCGNIVNIFSTLSTDIHVDVCNVCHPFYTGKQRVLDSSGRVQKFRKHFSFIK